MATITQETRNSKQLVCAVCGTVAERVQASQLYCSTPCKALAQYRRSQGEPISDTEFPRRRRRRVHQKGGSI